MSIPGYRPIPAGYISLLDYAKKHGKDVVSLACAAWRHDIPAWKWTLKDRSGVRNDVVKVIVVKEDAICPAYVQEARAAKGSENESAENNYEAKGMKLADFAFELGVSNTQVGEYFIRLGSNIKEIKTQTDYQIMLARMRKLREEIKQGKFYGDGKRGGKRKVEPPEGYESVEDVARRLGHCKAWIKTLARKGKLESVRVQGIVFIKAGSSYSSKRSNGLLAGTITAPEGYESTKDVARRLGVTPKHVSALVRQGKLGSIKSHGFVFIDKSSAYVGRLQFKAGDGHGRRQ